MHMAVVVLVVWTRFVLLMRLLEADWELGKLWTRNGDGIFVTLA